MKTLFVPVGRESAPDGRMRSQSALAGISCSWFVLLASSVALGQSGGAYEIRRSAVHAAAATTCSSGAGAYRLRGNIGEPATEIVSGGIYDLTGGFLATAPPAFTGPISEPSGLDKNRFLSFLVPPDHAGEPFAIRVRLTSLHHPATPSNPPDFTAFEGQYRYVNVFLDTAGQPVFDCPDTPAGASYKCATLGCAAEYRDWSSEFGGSVLHVTGEAVIPSSEFEIGFLRASCNQADPECCPSSAELRVTTAQWGDVVPGALNILDVSGAVDKLKVIPTALSEPSILIRANGLTYPDNVNLLDVAFVVDALKGFAYPFSGPSACP